MFFPSILAFSDKSFFSVVQYSKTRFLENYFHPKFFFAKNEEGEKKEKLYVGRRTNK